MFDPNLSFVENLEYGQMIIVIIFSVFAIVAPITVKLAKTPKEREQTGGIWSILLALCGAATLFTIIAMPIIRAAYAPAKPQRQVLHDARYESPTPKENCYLCGENPDTLLSVYRNEDNIAIVDLNTFDFLKLEINRYDMDGSLITEEAGFMRLCSLKLRDETSLSFYVEPDRAYADGKIALNENSRLEYDSAASFLCSDCISGLMNSYTYDDEQMNVALINLKDGDIRALDKSTVVIGLGDFAAHSSYDEETNKLDLLIWYAPPRYD